VDGETLYTGGLAAIWYCYATVENARVEKKRESMVREHRAAHSGPLIMRAVRERRSKKVW
jgi:hypothetical protein